MYLITTPPRGGKTTIAIPNLNKNIDNEEAPTLKYIVVNGMYPDFR
jgi:hypothetical protein